MRSSFLKEQNLRRKLYLTETCVHSNRLAETIQGSQNTLPSRFLPGGPHWAISQIGTWATLRSRVCGLQCVLIRLGRLPSRMREFGTLGAKTGSQRSRLPLVSQRQWLLDYTYMDAVEANSETKTFELIGFFLCLLC